ncbi:zinc finger and BTB domain-containing protein 18-like isoform X2 [Armigeres subalbatus]|uniref:zinc finger and BTB domain-containing protein 18-like isoform X2 n=1 Tax=Armigeres subalbatus TaxID=124917 RepID=UPI002ED5F551
MRWFPDRRDCEIRIQILLRKAKISASVSCATYTQSSVDAMENDEYPLEYFCRLCASEGVVIHPLFPPGDEDPKDELVRMIDVLTSVILTRTQDSGAVICDKCLQMLDLFCQFREECLRQDVMIRTRRELEKERQEEEERRLAAEQQLAAAAAAVAGKVAQHQIIPIEPDVLIKEEEEPPTIVIDDCKDEPDDEDDDDEDEGEEPQSTDSSLVLANSSSFQSPAEISLYSQTSSLSISVQVNQISLGGSSPGLIGLPVPPSASSPPANISSDSRPARVAFRKGKLDPNKPPPDCEVCQESFATHYDFEQHMDNVHAWDRGTRCSLACDPCQMRFTKSYNLKRHMYEVHGELAPGLTVTACEYCGLKFLRGYTLNRHITKVHSKHRKAKKVMIIKIQPT